MNVFVKFRNKSGRLRTSVEKGFEFIDDASSHLKLSTNIIYEWATSAAPEFLDVK